MIKNEIAFWMTTIGGIVALLTLAGWLYQWINSTLSPQKLPVRFRWRKMGSRTFHKACISLYQLVKSHYVPEIIIGCSRGGAVVAGILSKHFNITMGYIDFTSEIVNGEKQYKRVSDIGVMIKDKKILIVDDAPHTGKMLAVAKQHLVKKKPSEIKTAVIISQENTGQLDSAKQRAMYYAPEFKVYYSYRNDYKMPYE